MATNAPYYQMRGQFTNAANAQFVPSDVDEYDLSAPVTPHDDALYTDRQPSETPIATLDENHNFVELLEAATTAAGQAAHAMNTDNAASGAAIPNKGKRKRVSSPPADESSNPVTDHEQGDAASGSKRARLDVPTDPQLHGTEGMRGRSESSSVPPSSESLLNDARAAGVHSAAALFRRSLEKSSRKYTRPPMSKLFMSLQLTPENFLHLQAQAKAYMLDPAHPDRQSCVGNRGKGDTDMVKLRLFNCVRNFLNGGAGEEFFGEYVEKPSEKDAMEAARALGEEKAPTEDKLVWPGDGNKIISLVTPLLRRMVTNERQRMYAIETRKGGAKGKEASVEATLAHDNNQGMSAPNDPAYIEQAPAIASNLTHLQPLTPAQYQSQHPYPTSAASPLPTHLPSSSQTAYPAFAMGEPRKYVESPKPSIELPQFANLELPKEPPAEPIVDKLNIFLVKSKIRLECVTRLVNSDNAPLYHMSWEEFSDRVRDLITAAVYRYPQLWEEMKQKDEQASEPQEPPGMGPEALRGLAVAATEIQNEDSMEIANDGLPVRTDSLQSVSTSNVSTQAIAPTSRPQTPANPAMSPPSTVLPERLLPKFKVWTMWSPGQRDITNGQEWHEVKLDVAYAVWADRMLNVVVELL